MIKAIDISEIPQKSRGHVIGDIEELAASDSAACEVFGEANKSAESLYSSYYRAARESKRAIKVIRRKNRVFLVRQ